MSLGYDRPLYLLPFDHRHSYVTDMFHLKPALTTDQIEAVAADYVAQKATRQVAASRIAQRYRQWATIFERAHSFRHRVARCAGPAS